MESSRGCPCAPLAGAVVPGPLLGTSLIEALFLPRTPQVLYCQGTLTWKDFKVLFLPLGGNSSPTAARTDRTGWQ